MDVLLLPHPTTPPRSIVSVACTLRRDGAALDLRYAIAGAPGALLLAPGAEQERTDGLWRTTCMELFVGGADEAYREYNFSPSGAWAAYAFAARRTGMAALPMGTPPRIDARQGEGATLVSVQLPDVGSGPLRLGITAVIEETDGTKSYWALRHGGDAPDFHDPDCFVAQLPPAD
ncbi:DOMON-like domain-containing protein [Sphingomonas trueperi]|uniref:DOMON-like domain-containing protein n=1 Tax=Sphingomonas trueperi TaxID=53317 RepID=UPI000EAF5D9B